jgi:hypothetical protein
MYHGGRRELVGNIGIKMTATDTTTSKNPAVVEFSFTGQ